MKKVDSLGQFEQLVLAAVLALGDDAYGVTIHAKIEELAHPKSVGLGAVYVTLDRLEDKGDHLKALDADGRARRSRETALRIGNRGEEGAAGIGGDREADL